LTNWLLFFFVFITGAITGSFLNVVIYRYPIMLKTQWRKECAAFLNQATETEAMTFNLFLPRSHCPHCQTMIPIWHNIPIVSFILLLGKCRNCKNPISLRYPIVELLTAILSVVIVAKFDLSWITLAIWIFTCGLIILSFIDWQHQLLPDNLTLALLWLGLICATQNLFITPTSAVLGATIGYMFLWIIAKIYFLIRKQEGLGYGDFKMLAMLGAWVGTMSILNILLLSSVLALVINLYFLIRGKITTTKPVPFGPYLAIAGWITIVYGPILGYMR